MKREDAVARDGRIEANGRSVTYAEIIGDRTFALKVDPKAAWKDPASYTIVGKPVARLDIPAKVTGRFTYMHDFKVPGMLHARVVRPAAMKADLQAVDDSAAKLVPGYVATVRDRNFLAVVAQTEWGAIKAAQALKVQWSVWDGLPDQTQLWAYVRKTKINKDETLQGAGNTADAMQNAAKKVVRDLRLRDPYPRLDRAIVFGGGIQGRQADELERVATNPPAAPADGADAQDEARGRSLHLRRRRRLLRPQWTRRCGGRCRADRKQLGKPVRVQWTRADEHGWDPKGPPTLLDYRGALDASGNVVGWESEVFIPDRPSQISVTLLTADLADLPREPAHPGNIHQGLAIPYTVPNIKAVAHWLAETPFKPSWIRTPGRMQNTFGNECFLDECAAVSGVDPIDIDAAT